MERPVSMRHRSWKRGTFEVRNGDGLENAPIASRLVALNEHDANGGEVLESAEIGGMRNGRKLEENEAVVLLDVENQLREIDATPCVEASGDLGADVPFRDGKIAVARRIGGGFAVWRERRRGSGDAELSGAARPTAAGWLQRGLHLIVGGFVVDLCVRGRNGEKVRNDR